MFSRLSDSADGTNAVADPAFDTSIIHGHKFFVESGTGEVRPKAELKFAFPEQSSSSSQPNNNDTDMFGTRPHGICIQLF